MDLSNFSPSIDVLPERPLRVQDGQGRRIAVLQGAIWITQQGDSRDLVLREGEAFVLDRPGLTVLAPLGGPARVAPL